MAEFFLPLQTRKTSNPEKNDKMPEKKNVLPQLHLELIPMRLVIHNMLTCNVKTCQTNNFPLKIVASAIDYVESEYNHEYIVNLLPKLEWNALVEAAKDVNANIPSTFPENPSEEFLRNLYKLLHNVHIIEGSLKCPNCHRQFPITRGIPNMLLNENEI
ncbi:multifunctional methyltransferase subunit TRM112-like protein [Schistocerca gregaria]|uniref:multifunctional methyltransferase subunit TRM112-like protein n=1 Tax=Schistocerca gregaria TaxID=7010 RepID=UPI00211EC3D4|nr:multifunctional methyltransferase subunit TRM112-like protein [Schistocerca gregaria]